MSAKKSVEEKKKQSARLWRQRNKEYLKRMEKKMVRKKL
jgi:hypothetical protein